jgi:hypothetical protein
MTTGTTLWKTTNIFLTVTFIISEVVTIESRFVFNRKTVGLHCSTSFKSNLYMYRYLLRVIMQRKLFDEENFAGWSNNTNFD